MVSTTLENAGYRSTIIRKNVVEVIRKLKSQPGWDLSLSGATLAETCIRHRLVDEYLIYLNPVVLGGGRPMFPEGINRPLKLTETRSFGCGVVRRAVHD